VSILSPQKERRKCLFERARPSFFLLSREKTPSSIAAEEEALRRVSLNDRAGRGKAGADKAMAFSQPFAEGTTAGEKSTR